MESYFFKPYPDGRHLDIEVDGVLRYRWPSFGVYKHFTASLLPKVLSPHGQHRVLVLKQQVLAVAEEGVLDFYLPPEYRALSSSFPKQSLWDRFTRLFNFKKEKHHAWDYYDSSSQ